MHYPYDLEINPTQYGRACRIYDRRLGNGDSKVAQTEDIALAERIVGLLNCDEWIKKSKVA